MSGRRTSTGNVSGTVASATMSSLRVLMELPGLITMPGLMAANCFSNAIVCCEIFIQILPLLWCCVRIHAHVSRHAQNPVLPDFRRCPLWPSFGDYFLLVS